MSFTSDDMIDFPGLMDAHSRWSFSQQSAKPNGISKNMRENKTSQGSVGWCWVASDVRRKVTEDSFHSWNEVKWRNGLNYVSLWESFQSVKCQRSESRSLCTCTLNMLVSAHVCVSVCSVCVWTLFNWMGSRGKCKNESLIYWYKWIGKMLVEQCALILIKCGEVKYTKISLL